MNYEVTTSQVKTNEFTGRFFNKKVLYMVNALSFGDAEKRAIKYMEKKEILGDVTHISMSDVSFVDKFKDEFLFKIKVIFLAEDEITGQLRNTSTYELISADTPEGAIYKARDRYSEIKGKDYSLDQSSKTPFIDIINYKF